MERASGLSIAEASGTVEQAIADSKICVVRRKLRGLAGAYYPARVGRPHGLLALGEHAEPQVYVLALAHHYLEHRSLPYYAYEREGVCSYNSPLDRREAQLWVVEFAANTAPPMTIRLPNWAA